MPYLRVSADTNVNNVIALYQLGITANGAAASEWFAELALMVALPDGHGGIKFNLRLPSDAFGEVSGGFVAQSAEGLSPGLSVPWAGIGVNKGAIGAAINYLMFDPPGAWSGVIEGRWSVKLGAIGAGSFDVARVRSGGAAPVIKTGSILSLRAP